MFIIVKDLCGREPQRYVQGMAALMIVSLVATLFEYWQFNSKDDFQIKTIAYLIKYITFQLVHMIFAQRYWNVSIKIPFALAGKPLPPTKTCVNCFFYFLYALCVLDPLAEFVTAELNH